MLLLENRRWKIYCYTNKINNKKYIGQTKTSLKERAGRKGNGYEGCVLFWRAINKYGWESFESQIIKEHLTLEESNYWEEIYIKKYNSANSDYGYNIRIGGNNSLVSEETKKKLSKFHKGKQKGKDNPMYGKHHSLEARKSISEKHKAELNANYGKKMTEEQKEKISKTKKDNYKKYGSKLKGVKKTKEAVHNNALSQKNRKEVLQYSLDGEFIKEYISQKEASRQTGINQGNLNSCCKHKKGYKTAGGFIWINKEELNDNCIDKDMKLVDNYIKFKEN